MGSRGDCYHDALAESCSATLKKELIRGRSWPSKADCAPRLRLHRDLPRPGRSTSTPLSSARSASATAPGHASGSTATRSSAGNATGRCARRPRGRHGYRRARAGARARVRAAWASSPTTRRPLGRHIGSAPSTPSCPTRSGVGFGSLGRGPVAMAGRAAQRSLRARTLTDGSCAFELRSMPSASARASCSPRAGGLRLRLRWRLGRARRPPRAEQRARERARRAPPRWRKP